MILFLRSILYLLLACLITAPFGLFVTLSVVLPMRVRFQLIAIWRTLFMALCRYVLGIRYEVIGRENIPAIPSACSSPSRSFCRCASVFS